MSRTHTEIIERYVQTAVKIRSKTEPLNEELVQWQPGPGQWSILEIVGHLVDSNIVNSYRLRKIISEPVTALATYAHEPWVEQQQFNEDSLAEMLDIYEAITRYNAFLLRKLTPEQWLLYGFRQEEPITLERIVDNFICDHVETHLKQIDRNQTAYSQLHS